MNRLNSVLIGVLFLTTSLCVAQPTKVVVRAKAKDAKFIGSSVGGAKIVVRNAATNEVLSEGITAGSTGNTDRIMKSPHERYVDLADESTAKFEALLAINEPTFVTIQAIAPFNQKQAHVMAQTQLWVIPDKDIAGDGIVLEIPGFIVNVLSPQTHESIEEQNAERIELKANVVMMCGCPLTNGGLWDAEKVEVSAILKKNNEVIATVPMEVKEKANTFEAAVDLSVPGLYEITIYAYDARTGNTGVDKVNFLVN